MRARVLAIGKVMIELELTNLASDCATNTGTLGQRLCNRTVGAASATCQTIYHSAAVAALLANTDEWKI